MGSRSGVAAHVPGGPGRAPGHAGLSFLIFLELLPALKCWDDVCDGETRGGGEIIEENNVKGLAMESRGKAGI